MRLKLLFFEIQKNWRSNSSKLGSGGSCLNGLAARLVSNSLQSVTEVQKSRGKNITCAGSDPTNIIPNLPLLPFGWKALIRPAVPAIRFVRIWKI